MISLASVRNTPAMRGLYGRFPRTICRTTVVLAGGIGIYIVKSAAGIDLIEGPSFLHDYFYLW